MGDLIEKRGDDALAQGHNITARDYYLRAGIYHYNAERFIQPGLEKKAQCVHAYKVWHQGIKLRQPNVEFIEVPYEGTTLPALFMKTPGEGRQPTVVVVNGMDNAKEMSNFFCGLEFARRGTTHSAWTGEMRRMRDCQPLRLRSARHRSARISADALGSRSQARTVANEKGCQLWRLN